MTYQIVVIATGIENINALRDKLQTAYDNGAAGEFSLKQQPGSSDLAVEITFSRELPDDEEYLERRIRESGATATQAAFVQLADELAEGNGDELSQVIDALRADNALLRGSFPAAFAAQALSNGCKPIELVPLDEAGHYDLQQEGSCVAEVHVCGTLFPATQEQLVKQLAAAPELAAALLATIAPLIRLGDFVGNHDHGGASGMGEFDRCAILLQARTALAKAGILV